MQAHLSAQDELLSRIAQRIGLDPVPVIDEPVPGVDTPLADEATGQDPEG